MEKSKNINTGITFGIIIGLLYCILLFLRWQNAENLIRFGILAFVNYLLVLGIMFYEANYRRKQEEGNFISVKNLFQTLFISVLIFELVYGIFNFVYLKYIDPEVITRMKNAVVQLMENAGNVSEKDKSDAISRFDDMKKSTEFLPALRSYAISIAISGVFALIIAAIMKKNKPVFQELS